MSSAAAVSTPRPGDGFLVWPSRCRRHRAHPRFSLVLWALDPRYAVAYLLHIDAWTAFVVLGSVFLALTGGEALYADMGHFGRRAIRVDWFAFVMPALALVYFGQGALVLTDPAAANNPFSFLFPDGR